MAQTQVSAALSDINTKLIGILDIKGQIFGSKNDKYQYLFRPFDGKYRPMLVWSKINRVREPSNIIGVVSPVIGLSVGAARKYDEGRLLQKIGNVNQIHDIRLGFLYHYGLSGCLKPKDRALCRVTDRAEAQASQGSLAQQGGLGSHRVPPVARAQDEDHTSKLVYSIDPEGCQDIDDAFCLECDGDDTLQHPWRLTIYIAEVTVDAHVDLDKIIEQPFTIYNVDGKNGRCDMSVSYTHLDVYKRQA